MTTVVLRTFEVYQKARVQFVQTIAALADSKENFDALESAGVLHLLKPLLLDVVPSVSQTACIAIGRMAEKSHHIAEEIVKLDILPDIVEPIEKQNVDSNYVEEVLQEVRCVRFEVDSSSLQRTSPRSCKGRRSECSWTHLERVRPERQRSRVFGHQFHREVRSFHSIDTTTN